MRPRRQEPRDVTWPHDRRTTRLHELAKRAAIPLLVLLLTAAAHGQSALDGFSPGPNGEIGVVVVQPDGKLLILGNFTTLSPNGGPTVARNGLARLNSDGTVDMAFDAHMVGAGVASIALQADGKILVGGVFTSIGGQPRHNIARLDGTTGAADSFDPDSSNSINTIVVQADGKILVASSDSVGTNTIGGQTRHWIARLDPTTGAADSFNPSPNFYVSSIVLQKDGKILVGGGFGGANSIGGQTRNFIARLDPMTGLADSFNPDANDAVDAIAVQADGKILVGGLFQGIGGQPRNRIARLDPKTGAADSFDPHAFHIDPGYHGSVVSIAVQADGKILAGGYFTNIGGQMRKNVARLDPTTGLADSFDPHPSEVVNSIALQADGKIFLGGSSGAFVRFETDGRLDQTLDSNIVGPPGTGFVLATAVQPDGKILIGGIFTTVLGVARNNIARLNTDGTLDAAFDPNANADVHAIAIQADGKILVGGNFSVALGQNSIGGQPRNRIARLDPTTGLADSFNPDAGAVVMSIAVQADGKILAGGSFQGLGGQMRRFIARLDPTGLADSFDPNPNNTVFSIALQADGKILAGGDFANIGGQLRNRIARLDPNSGLADSFDPNASGLVYSIGVQADGKVLAGGQFANIGGQTRNNIARLDATTGLADSFNPNANSNVYSIALQADGKILAGGNFTSVGGQARNFFARFDPTTGLADSFNPNANNQVFSITIPADGKILVGGAFSGTNSIGGQARNFFARLSNDTAALQDLAVTRTTITWTRGGSSPQFTRVSFESSTDNMSFAPLGNGTAAGSNWILTGLNLPIRHNLYIRAHGYRPSGDQNGSESVAESVRNAFLTPSTFGNISTRLRVQAGDNAMIGGFIITGTERKTVIVRGLGPSLPMPGALADPVIEVHGPAGQLFATNDNWRDGKNAKQVAATLPPANDLESALWGILDPEAHTVVVRGKNGTTGIGLFEVYDLDQTVDSKLANISTRGFVETGENIMVGGIIIVGTRPARVIFRAIGPSLTNFGVPNALLDPTLELRDADGDLIAGNDNWRSDQEAEIIATGIPPSNDLESAIVRDLVPGNYTAIVRGVNGTTGTAVVEAYALD